MEQALKILLLEDSYTDAEIIKRLVKKAKPDCEIHLATDKKNFLTALDNFSPDVILSDNSLPQFDATDALQIVRQRSLQVPFILVTGTVSEEFAAGIIKQGADDYILKDRMARLPAAIDTALKQRKALKEITDYKYALDQSAIIAITDQKGIILYANDNFCKISGYSKEELIGQDHRIINSGYHPKSYIRELWRTIANGEIWKGEFCNRAKGGRLYWVETTIVPFLNEQGKPYQYLSIRIDITEQKKAQQELQTARDRLYFHIENSPLGFIEWDRELHVKSWSKQAEEIFGWTEEEFTSLKKDGYSLVYKEDLPFVSNIALQMASGKIDRTQLQHRNYTKDGRVIWCEWFNSVLRDEDGKMLTLMSLVQDITERKQVEEEQIQSEKRLRQAQAISHLGNWEINFITGTSKWSDEAYRIYGLEPAEHNLSMEDWMSFIHPEDVGYVKQLIEESQVNYNDISFHHRIVRKDGIVRNIFSQNKYEFNKQGTPIGLYSVAHDVTESKEAEEELSRNELRFRTLTGNAPVGIFQTDASGKTIYVNEAWMKITGLTFDEAMVDGWITVLHPDDKQKQIEQWQDKLQSGLESSSEFRLIDKKGNTRWVTGKATPLFDKNHQITGYIGTLSDITENKKAEEKIQKSEEQYRDLVENITDLICTHDLDGRVLSVNRAAEELIGRKFNPEENLNIKDLLAPDRKDEFNLYITAIKKMGRVQGLMKVKTFTGKTHIWEYNNSLKTTGVNTAIVRGYARDITESRIAQENLRKSEARLKEAQSVAHISNWEIDLVQNIHTWSDEFYRIYGINKDEVQPSAELFLSFMHPEDASFAQKKIQEAFDTLKDSSFNFRFIRKDGAARHGYTEWRFEFDKKGKPLRLYGILQDITERKQAEEERKRLESRLLEQQRREQLTITATTLEAQERERNAIGVELHDNVNQILVGTKLLLSTVKNTSDKEKNLVALCIENLQNAIEENRKIAHTLVTPDLETDTLIDQISRLTHSMLETAGLQVHTDTSSYMERLLDKDKKIAVYRIAQEQCTNIVKYAKAETVNISLSATNKIFKMIIADNGIGMKDGKKTKGIGLRNINSRLSVFNGKANIITAPGEGFTLEIEIPISI